MRLFRPWYIMRRLYRGALFRIETTEKILCLTFDDGPNPASTPALLAILGKNDIKGIFFCDGRKAEQYPSLIAQIRREGHIIGNHGYSHLNGWLTADGKYCRDITFASQYTSGDLFRPPYGRIRISQFRRLREQFRIVFWDLMPYDFDRKFGTARVLAVLSGKLRNGSIIVLHDNSDSNLPEILPALINIAQSEGYRFVIPSLN